MKTRAITLAAAIAVGLVVTVSVFAAAPKSAALVIHHQVRGCHSWSLNGGPFIVRQVVALGRGGSLTVTNNDLMVQDLLKTSGPAVKMKLVKQSHMGNMPMAMHMEGIPSPYAMAHPGAQVRVTFSHSGTYTFKLVDRGDYYKGIRTVGPDNEPTLKVVVS
jgi:hypothetical protein